MILGSGLENTQKGLVALSRALSQRGVAKNIQVCFFDDWNVFGMKIYYLKCGVLL